MKRKACCCIAILFALTAGAVPPRRGAVRKPAPIHKPAPLDAAAVNNPGTRPDLNDDSTGAAVLRAQILLDRAHFSVGQIDAKVGDNTKSAVAGFRATRQLPPGNQIDQDVWNALNMDSSQALIEYTVTDADLAGPFVKRPPDLMAQAKLMHLGYASPLDELAERFHVAPAVLARLNPGKAFSQAGEKLTVPNVGTEITGTAARVVVSKSKNTVTALDADGHVLAQYPCTSGSEHDPLPIGDWKITGIAKNPKFHYNPDLFWDAKPQDSKATIAPGPRNPVGVVWMDLSKEHYGIHGTPDPSLVGHAQSHGCIRLTNWDASQLAGLVKPGTPASLIE